ncbi:hypothetical protein EVAR_39515_1 [Eumeta japonica]|uniref:Uncharacterized protein n=1 Tax=Eumeta variegata TaxID=151549 RepID=A0A4C1W2T1_EUMVA|nr:hypothetical protein EVAR_39515_1 [Eumeta japonica]
MGVYKSVVIYSAERIRRAPPERPRPPRRRARAAPRIYQASAPSARHKTKPAVPYHGRDLFGRYDSMGGASAAGRGNSAKVSIGLSFSYLREYGVTIDSVRVSDARRGMRARRTRARSATARARVRRRRCY